MKRRLLSGLVLATLLAGAALAGAAHAAERWPLEAGEIDLKEFARLVSKATGRTILYGADFSGTVTLELKRTEFTGDELWQLFLSALAQEGWGVVVHGSVVRIAPRRELISQDSPVVVIDGEEPVTSSDELVTATFELNHVNPGEIVLQLSAFVGPEGQVIPLPSQGRLVVVATAANVEKIRLILAKIDVPEKRQEIQVVRLDHADPEDVAQIVDTLLSAYALESGRFTHRQTVGGVIVAPEPRNSVLVIRGEKRDVEAAAQLARVIDQDGDPAVLVRTLQHSDASAMAATLGPLLKKTGR